MRTFHDIMRLIDDGFAADMVARAASEFTGVRPNDPMPPPPPWASFREDEREAIKRALGVVAIGLCERYARDVPPRTLESLGRAAFITGAMRPMPGMVVSYADAVRSWEQLDDFGRETFARVAEAVTLRAGMRLRALDGTLVAIFANTYPDEHHWNPTIEAVHNGVGHYIDRGAFKPTPARPDDATMLRRDWTDGTARLLIASYNITADVLSLPKLLPLESLDTATQACWRSMADAVGTWRETDPAAAPRFHLATVRAASVKATEIDEAHLVAATLTGRDRDVVDGLIASCELLRDEVEHAIQTGAATTDQPDTDDFGGPVEVAPRASAMLSFRDVDNDTRRGLASMLECCQREDIGGSVVALTRVDGIGAEDMEWLRREAQKLQAVPRAIALTHVATMELRAMQSSEQTGDEQKS